MVNTAYPHNSFTEHMAGLERNDMSREKTKNLNAAVESCPPIYTVILTKVKLSRQWARFYNYSAHIVGPEFESAYEKEVPGSSRTGHQPGSTVCRVVIGIHPTGGH